MTRQERAAEAWIEKYAGPRIEAAGGRARPPQEVRAGMQEFDAIRSAHQATTEAFDSRVRQASTDASFRLKGTILAVVLLALAAWYVISAVAPPADRPSSPSRCSRWRRSSSGWPATTTRCAPS